MLVKWSDIKSLINSNQARLNYIERADEYLIVASSVSIAFECALEKGTAEATEFEQQYKLTKVNVVEPLDSDGSRIQRTKTTKTGWHYEPRSLDFITSTANSLYNRMHTGNTVEDSPDYNDCIMKFFDAAGLELTLGQGESAEGYQTRLSAYCTRTQIDWHPQYDLDIIGADFGILTPPVAPQKAYAWIIVAPDIPPNLGGNVVFLSGGLNLGLLPSGDRFPIDGRGVRSFVYDPVYYSNKFRFLVKHTAGLQLTLQVNAWQFKA